MDLQLTDRVFVVTGGGRGLGRATAEQLLAEGARVLVSGRREEPLRELAAAHPGRADWEAADNADPATPQRLLGAARERLGGLDGVVISVGGPPPGTVTGTTDEQWRSGFESVFLGAVRLARATAESLPDGGSITLVLSTSVKEPLPGLTVSNGLRPGLAMVAKDLAREVGPRGIRVNGVMPGRIATDRVRELDEGTGDPDASRHAHEAAIPLGRYGEPEEFGRVAAFLASPAASFVSGAIVPVDGGALRSL